ncbi:uncharacterized protein [Palaemon carinicauda]|uniref:uncharacterized protein n=1 Tax=Palaemon carinicauda TaxID=392227 RepID=UPI0035B6A615
MCCEGGSLQWPVEVFVCVGHGGIRRLEVCRGRIRHLWWAAEVFVVGPWRDSSSWGVLWKNSESAVACEGSRRLRWPVKLSPSSSLLVAVVFASGLWLSPSSSLLVAVVFASGLWLSLSQSSSPPVRGCRCRRLLRLRSVAVAVAIFFASGPWLSLSPSSSPPVRGCRCRRRLGLRSVAVAVIFASSPWLSQSSSLPVRGGRHRLCIRSVAVAVVFASGPWLSPSSLHPFRGCRRRLCLRSVAVAVVFASGPWLAPSYSPPVRGCRPRLCTKSVAVAAVFGAVHNLFPTIVTVAIFITRGRGQVLLELLPLTGIEGKSCRLWWVEFSSLPLRSLMIGAKLSLLVKVSSGRLPQRSLMEGIAVARTVGRRPRNPLKYHYNLKRLNVIIVGAKFSTE